MCLPGHQACLRKNWSVRLQLLAYFIKFPCFSALYKTMYVHMQGSAAGSGDAERGYLEHNTLTHVRCCVSQRVITRLPMTRIL